MSHQLELPPSAASLSESMRDLGYSLETAVADIVDNSISADATKVDIICDLSRESPTLVILDDGIGMSSDELLLAMRHGARVPRDPMPETDLGRFGLGMKTASFSQCRLLTVVSAQMGNLAGAEWNLDVVAELDGWFVSVLDQSELSLLPYFSKLAQTGTMVIWRNLDRLSEYEKGTHRDEIINEKLEILRSHLSLVFHRFLSGEVGRKKLTITVNGMTIQAFDPFCRSNPATQKLPKDVVKIDGHKVDIQAYVLPHHSRLSAKEYDFYRTRSDFISNQGAYIYRNGRLMAWGDWFRLIPKGEATKLGRVQIDFPNALDQAWTIDIKKSRARPPLVVREHLRRIIPKITSTAVRVHKGRGQRLYEEIESPIWERYADQDRIRYAVNQTHPLVGALLKCLAEEDKKKATLLFDSIATSLPIEMIYSDYSLTPKGINLSPASEAGALERLRELQFLLFPDRKPDRDEFLKLIISTRLFELCTELVERYMNEEMK